MKKRNMEERKNGYASDEFMNVIGFTVRDSERVVTYCKEVVKHWDGWLFEH